MLDLLRTAGGPDCVLAEAAARRYLSRDQTTAPVVAPRDAESAAAIMALAIREGWSMRCAGAGTRSATDQRAPDLVITTARMHGVSEYEPADLVMTVQAGATLSQIAAATAPHRQFLALDPPLAGTATIGGVVATAAAGPLRHAHGTPRDQVLGLELVAGDARVLRFGGKVVKNVAGYDVVRPVVGSRGTLGLITEISMRLKPLPEADSTASIATDAIGTALDVVETMIAAQLELVALEIVSPALAVELGATGWVVLARLHGNAAAVREETSRVRALAARYPVEVAADASKWDTLSRIEAAAPVNVRLADLPSRLRETAGAALRMAGRAPLAGTRLAMHAGDGIVRLLAQDAGAAFEQIAVEERAALEARGGTLIVERAPRRLDLDAFGHIEARTLMQGVKRTFDPAGLLAAGTFAL